MFNHPNANDEGYYEANISSQTLEWIHKHTGHPPCMRAAKLFSKIADDESVARMDPRAWHGALIELAMCAVQYPGHVKAPMRDVVSGLATLDNIEQMALAKSRDLKRHTKINDTARAKRESFKIL